MSAAVVSRRLHSRFRGWLLLQEIVLASGKTLASTAFTQKAAVAPPLGHAKAADIVQYCKNHTATA